MAHRGRNFSVPVHDWEKLSETLGAMSLTAPEVLIYIHRPLTVQTRSQAAGPCLGPWMYPLLFLFGRM